jgi:hypothetical protein
MSDLAKRAVACRHWRWMPGMLIDDGTRLSAPLPHRMLAALDALPDLTDPATLGCLLALVREAWGRPGAVCACIPSDALWRCCGEYGATEAEALVAALEAAP